MFLSVEMLSVGGQVKLCALAVAAAMSFTVTGMSNGFGAVCLDLKQRNPAAIISSFGGTLNLVMNLCFMFAAIIPFAAIFHIQVRGHPPPGAVQLALFGAYAYLGLLTLLFTCLPLWLGRRSLLAREF